MSHLASPVLAVKIASLDYGDPGAPGASSLNPLLVEPNKTEKFQSVHVRDTNGNLTDATLILEAQTAAGAPTALITATENRQGAGSYVIDVTAAAAAAPGTTFRVKVTVKERPGLVLFIYVKIK